MAALPPKPLLEPDPSNGFTRAIVLVELKPVLRSSCGYCGVMLSAPTSEAVWRLENEHREHCSPKKAMGVSRKP